MSVCMQYGQFNTRQAFDYVMDHPNDNPAVDLFRFPWEHEANDAGSDSDEEMCEGEGASMEDSEDMDGDTAATLTFDEDPVAGFDAEYAAILANDDRDEFPDDGVPFLNDQTR